ncbi:MAG: type II toxin-antitoxin system VapC family toxin [Candidatus Bathyarchaeia archaeon]
MDASVAARFLLFEDLSDRARLLLESFRDGKVELKAPKLVRYEVGNTLWKAALQKLMAVNEAQEKFSHFLKLNMNSVELDEQECAEALAWGVRNNTTYYDSVYVKATGKAGAILLTADDILYMKASKTVPALHLRDLPSR